MRLNRLFDKCYGIPQIPFVKGSDTSLGAARSVKGSAVADARRVFKLIGRNMPRGMTCDEVEHALGMAHQTTSARIFDLVEKGLLRDSGRRRLTRRGRKARVLVVDPNPQPLAPKLSRTELEQENRRLRKKLQRLRRKYQRLAKKDGADGY